MQDLIRRYVNSRGSVMIVAMVVITTMAMFSIAFAMRIAKNEKRMESDIARTKALHTAIAANDVTVQKLWTGYNWVDPSSFNRRRTDQRVAWLAGEDLNGNGLLDPGEDVNYNGTLDTPAFSSFSNLTWSSFGNGQVKTEVQLLARDGKEYADVMITSTARVEDARSGYWVERAVRKVVRYGLAPSEVFDFVYFANNFGWMYGGSLKLYGNMGANGNLNFSGNPTVDGMLFAARNPQLGALGTVNGTARHDTVSQYQTLAGGNTLMRPTNPAAATEDSNGNGALDPSEDTNGNGVLDVFDYEAGYDGSQEKKTGQTPIYMPYLGDLEMYKDIAKNSQRIPRTDIAEYSPEDTNSNGVLDDGEDSNGNGTLDWISGGVVKQLKAPGLDPTDPANYNIIINQVYGDDAGENGKYTTEGSGNVTLNDVPTALETDPVQQKVNGNLALIGTPDQPIVISGPVVITNDLVIKGVVKGQGTFYVGRNTHVVNSLVYSDAPEWQQNDANFFGNGVLDAGEDTNGNTVLDPGEDLGTTELNKRKDGVGFATKGSVVLGNYTRTNDSWGTAHWYMGNGFTQSYGVDPDDADIGYVTGTDANGNPTFHGNYLALDGVGKKYTIPTTGDPWTVPASKNRKYYESSFPDAYIQSIEGAASGKPEHIHGIFYTNHMYGGRTNKVKLYGALVCRDEAIVTNTSGDFFYDPRIAKGELSTYIELFLPRDSLLEMRLFEEIEAVQKANERAVYE